MKRRVLITGANGFVGTHLTHHLLDTTPEIELFGAILPGSRSQPRSGISFHEIDLKHQEQVHELIADVRPDHIYHLAAQAFVPRSFEDPWETLENNIRSQLNVILACLACNIKPRMLIIGSAEVYGPVQPDELPITEKAALRPTSPYSVSKIAQDMLGLQYYLSHNFPIFRARSFNHFGPGQSESFVAPSFAYQIARAEAGQQALEIRVGDLSAQRDFTDVRDIVHAYHLIVEKGIPGEAYNVASGKTYSIQTLLDTLITLSSIDIQVIVDTERLRPVAIPVMLGDYTKLRQTTGWNPAISFEQSLYDILTECRQRVDQQTGQS